MFMRLLLRGYRTTIILATFMLLYTYSFPQMMHGGPSPIMPGTVIGNAWDGLNARWHGISPGCLGWRYANQPPYGWGGGWNRWGNRWNNAFYNTHNQRSGSFYPWNGGYGWSGVGY
ncbi:hypothetical protein Tcan_05295 [Toxocara canis]|uniref:Uncharacterized protein n=1 Tax=Toxocara canis TaxID=6265 RepID=A0A0B2VC72_TOXCA|nr:hypothetical protein Tcan_05295 [Toxocara canis]